MVMSVTEASAAQDVLQLAAANIRQLIGCGDRDSNVIVTDEYGRELTLGQIKAAGHTLADQSYKKLHAGLNGDRWDQLIDPDADQ